MEKIRPKWLIEDFDPDDSRVALIEEVKRQGLQCEVVCYIPFESGDYNMFPDSYDQCVVFQGSLNLARQLRSKRWVPGVWCDLKQFKCSTYYPYFGKFLLNQDYFFVPVFELRRRKDNLYQHLGLDDTIFIRPDSGFKTFTGKLVERRHFDADLEWMEEFSDKDSLAVVSTPKVIQEEYRLIVCKRQVVTGSVYRQDSDRKYVSLDDINAKMAAEITDFACRCCDEADWEPERIFVMDICLVGGSSCVADNLRIMELNSFSCSGLYACNLERVVSVASSLASEEYMDLHQSRID